MIEIAMQQSQERETTGNCGHSEVDLDRLVDELGRQANGEVEVASDWIQQHGGTDGVLLKDASGAVLSANKAYWALFARGEPAIGSHETDLVHSSLRSAVRLSDAFLAGPGSRLDFRHEGLGSDGEMRSLRTIRFRIREISGSGWAIAGVTRTLARLRKRTSWIDVSEQGRYEAFFELRESDRWVCQQVAIGRTSVSIATELGISRRAVEMRKRKALETLQLENTAQLIRLLVRLNDGGHADLGL